jgi:hypothetical protein
MGQVHGERSEEEGAVGPSCHIGIWLTSIDLRGKVTFLKVVSTWEVTMGSYLEIESLQMELGS